jgi:hypothetical protein
MTSVSTEGKSVDFTRTESRQDQTQAVRVEVWKKQWRMRRNQQTGAQMDHRGGGGGGPVHHGWDPGKEAQEVDKLWGWVVRKGMAAILCCQPSAVVWV